VQQGRDLLIGRQAVQQPPHQSPITIGPMRHEQVAKELAVAEFP
jgi:hypothetical protein